MNQKFNPKSQAPSVYIPCWLIQVPAKLLSHAAKILYGRLAQWSNEKGDVHRSVKQLAIEIGTTPRQIDRYLKELRDVKLIGTFQAQAGGVNHFEFYTHEWMNAAIKPELCYKDPEPPRQICRDPHDKIVATPTTNMSHLNIKEIKINNKKKNIKKKKESVDNFGLEQMQSDNPHNIGADLLKQWLINRKQFPVTAIAWQRTNRVLSQLVQKGITAFEAFERMVAAGWRGMEVRYFQDEIDQLNKKVPHKWDFESVFNA